VGLQMGSERRAPGDPREADRKPSETVANEGRAQRDASGGPAMRRPSAERRFDAPSYLVMPQRSSAERRFGGSRDAKTERRETLRRPNLPLDGCSGMAENDGDIRKHVTPAFVHPFSVENHTKTIGLKSHHKSV